MYRQEIVELIILERARQDKKWGADRELSNYVWLAILIEEVGEAGKAILDKDLDNLKEELIQCIAVIFAWLEAKNELE